MSDLSVFATNMPCPDCGHQVQPERDQLCPNCGYPLLFLRRSSGDSRARSVPRSPKERDDPTGVQPRVTAVALPPPAAARMPCRNCGYPNDPARVRCEHCGIELRAARPRPPSSAPVTTAPPMRRFGWIWLLVLAAVVLLVVTVLLAWPYRN